MARPCGSIWREKRFVIYFIILILSFIGSILAAIGCMSYNLCTSKYAYVDILRKGVREGKNPYENFDIATDVLCMGGPQIKMPSIADTIPNAVPNVPNVPHGQYSSGTIPPGYNPYEYGRAPVGNVAGGGASPENPTIKRKRYHRGQFLALMCFPSYFVITFVLIMILIFLDIQNMMPVIMYIFGGILNLFLGTMLISEWLDIYINNSANYNSAGASLCSLIAGVVALIMMVLMFFIHLTIVPKMATTEEF